MPESYEEGARKLLGGALPLEYYNKTREAAYKKLGKAIVEFVEAAKLGNQLQTFHTLRGLRMSLLRHAKSAEVVLMNSIPDAVGRMARDVIEKTDVRTAEILGEKDGREALDSLKGKDNFAEDFAAFYETKIK